MKKTLLLLVSALFCCGIAASAEPSKDFAVKATILSEGKTVFKPGDKIPLKLVCECPSETHQVGSWRAFAYLRDIPEGFEKMPGFKLKPHRDPKWSSVHTDQGRWFPVKLRSDKEFQIVLNTAGWPEGDYQMRIGITFMPLDKAGKFIYRAAPITFSLEN